MLKHFFIKFACLLFLLTPGIVAFAEDEVPVYDADSYSAAEGSSDSMGFSSSYGSPSSEEPLSMEQRLFRTEQKVKNLQRNNLSSKVESLQSEIQTLRGQVEQLTHQLKQLQTNANAKPSTGDATSSNELKTLRAEVDDLTKKLQQKEKNVGTANSSQVDTPAANIKSDTPPMTMEITPSSNDEQPNVAEEQQIYQTAYDLIKEKKYNEAINALQKMLKKYPSGQFAANAHYWLGELFGLLNKNDQSAFEFSSIVRNYPDSPKVADAQLKLGIIYTAQFRWSDAKAAFKKVINHYPGTASARLASEQLKQIKRAGH